MTIDALIAEGAPPIVAILRGITRHHVTDVAEAILDAGIRMIEVPLNSPDPIATIGQLANAIGDRALCGAGTVLSPSAVDAVASVGGRLIVTPNSDAAVITRAVSLGLEIMPGFVTPTEAFGAIDAGAQRLKLFPAGRLGPGYLRALREVLPKSNRIWAVGGADADTLRDWLLAGAEGIGAGGSLYRAGDGHVEVGRRATFLVRAWREVVDEMA